MFYPVCSKSAKTAVVKASAAGGRGGRGAPRRGRGGKAPRERKQPKTAEDLDKDLEAFMGTGNDKTASVADVPKDANGDVEMS